MRCTIFVILALLASAPATANDGYEDLASPSPPAMPGSPGPLWGGPDAVVLWDNGPLITGACPDNNPPGHESQVATGRNLIGWAHDVRRGYRLADDFTVPAGVEWNVRAITFFAYQTGAGPNIPSTINHVNLRVWDGQPGEPGAYILCGDSSTNLLVSSTWAEIYRTSYREPCAHNRAVMADMVEPPDNCPDCPGFPRTLRLPSGVYWLDWQSDGNPDYTGPWVPPINPPAAGQPPNNTMNAIQFLTEWNPLEEPDDLPFVIEGDFCGVTPIEASTWGAIKAQYK